MIDFISDENGLVEFMVSNLYLKFCFICLKSTVKVPDFVVIMCFNAYLTTMVSTLWLTSCVFTLNEDVA